MAYDEGLAERLRQVTDDMSVFVQPEGTESDADLKRWVDLAAAFVATLPPKKS